MIGDRDEKRLRRLGEKLLALSASPQGSEALPVCIETILETRQRPFPRTEEHRPRTARARPVEGATMTTEPHIDLVSVNNLTPGPSHIDPTPKLVESLRNSADGLRMALLGIPVLCCRGRRTA